MKHSLRIGIYTPYFHIAGGGEGFVGRAAQFLSQDHKVDLLISASTDVAQVQQRLNLDLSRVRIVPIHPSPARLASRIVGHLIDKYYRIRQVSFATKNYDLFLNQETLSVIPCHAKRGVLVCQIPPRALNPSTTRLDNALRLVFARLLFDYKARSYDRVIVYSNFVARFARRYYAQVVNVVYPPVDTRQFTALSKRNILLSVGRFFVGLHNKKQLELIRAFKTMYHTEPNMRTWQYHLAGKIDPNPKAHLYAQACQSEAQNYPIHFHFDCSFEDLRRLYGQAKIFWHGAGLGEDEETHPERVEHFGISTAEAMSAGCVPIVIGKGGQPELVRAGVDGFLWQTVSELVERTRQVIDNSQLCAQMQAQSQARSQILDLAHFEQSLRSSLNL